MAVIFRALDDDEVGQVVGVINAIINVLMAAGIGFGAAIWIGRGGERSSVRRIAGVLVGAALGGGGPVGHVRGRETRGHRPGGRRLDRGKRTDLHRRQHPLRPGPGPLVGLHDPAGRGWRLRDLALLWGNRVIDDPVLRTVAATLLGALAGYLLGTVEHRWSRLATGIGAGAVLGALAASGMRRVILVFELEQTTFELWPVLPDLDYGVLTISTLVGAAIALLLWQLRGRRTPLARRC